ncbi:MAG: flagellar export chaperone FliS [Chloroflexota bacterium]
MNLENLTPLELVRLLFRRGEELMAEAASALAEGRPEAAEPPIVRAQEVVAELLKALDLEKGGEVARNLRRLYIFVWERLVQASLTADAARLAEAQKVWSGLRAAWEEVNA